jgi:acetate kinase
VELDMSIKGGILTVNPGSGSLHVELYGWSGDETLRSESVDWRGDAPSAEQYVASVNEALDRLGHPKIAAIGHRVVHGGAEGQRGARINDAVKSIIRRYAPLAPQHNPVSLALIDALGEALPGIPQVAAFDTAFHHTLPPRNYILGVPRAWEQSWGVRRYGFHGLSHQYCAERAAALIGRPLAELKIITCHLGSGCSLCAVDSGRSVATTMGFTPLDGVMMSSRSGSLDPGLLLWLLETDKLTLKELREALEHESGLKGISGISADTRDLSEARARGDERAALALEVFVARIREAIAAMATAMGGIDTLTFADGIGENSPDLRAAIIEGLPWMGVRLDGAANAAAEPDRELSAEGAAVRSFVIHTREALMVARAVREALG